MKNYYYDISISYMKPLFFAFILVSMSCSPAQKHAISVSYFDLAEKPEQFSGKLVEVEGVLAMSSEQMLFENPDGKSRGSIWFSYLEFPKSEIKARGFDRLVQAFDQAPSHSMIEYKRIVRVRIEGVFLHAGKDQKGFGHLGAFPSEIRIEKVLEATPMRSDPAR